MSHIEMELSLRGLFQDFNATKAFVYGALLVFTCAFALRLDNVYSAPYVVVFTPLWLWKIAALAGALVGCVAHWKRPPARSDVAGELEYRTMVLCALQHLLLFVFEILACYKLDSGDPNLKWILVFVPLVFESIISIVICIWAVRQERGFEFEIFFCVNGLQFVFLALKLDNVVAWNWAVIFIPLWIVICLSLIGVLYAIILAVLLIRSFELLPERRRQHIWSAIGYTLLVVPLLVFLVLLTGKLDGAGAGDDAAAALPLSVVCTPLYVSLACLMLMACGTRGGNTLAERSGWFGMRTDVCTFLLESCPCLQEYGNVSYKFGRSANRRNSPSDAVQEVQVGDQPDAFEMASSRRTVANSRSASKDVFRTVCPVVTIEAPD